MILEDAGLFKGTTSERDFEPDDFVQIFKDLTTTVLDEFSSQYPCLSNGKFTALGQLYRNNLYNEVYVNLKGPELDLLLTNLESSVETLKLCMILSKQFIFLYHITSW
jgi:hypothetical protein